MALMTQGLHQVDFLRAAAPAVGLLVLNQGRAVRLTLSLLQSMSTTANLSAINPEKSRKSVSFMKVVNKQFVRGWGAFLGSETRCSG